MSAPKKLVIAGLSATAVVASIGYAFAQSTDDTALANSNWNGAQNSSEDASAANSGPPAMPSSAVTAYNAEIGAAGTMGDQPMAAADTTTTTTTIDTSSASSSSMAATDNSTSPWSAPATTTDPNATSPGAANPTAGTSPDKTDITHPAVAPQGDAARTDAGSNPSMTTNTMSAPAPAPAPAPAAAATQTETRVDLNSPNEPQYNLASDPWLRHRNANNTNSTGNAADNTSVTTSHSGERAPRADRN